MVEFHEVIPGAYPSSVACSPIELLPRAEVAHASLILITLSRPVIIFKDNVYVKESSSSMYDQNCAFNFLWQLTVVHQV